MTLSSAMILVDQTSVPLAIPDAMQDLKGPVSDGQWILTANMLPLAAFMVLGGRLGDIFGLKKIFLIGAAVFSVSSALAGLSQDLPWMIIARAVQGAGAALMMPTAVAIVSATYPKAERGRALGLLAGFAAFAAALGPVVGGGLASIDWRLVFLVNVPLAIATVMLTLRFTDTLGPAEDADRHLDLPGVVTFSIGIIGIVFGLGQGQAVGWGDPQVVIALGAAVLGFVAFGFVETRVKNPMIEFKLFRHLNFLAANISQFLAGMIELGTAYLLPYFLLVTIGFSPLVAGIALIPATIPIMIAGPLAGRFFDKVGGRVPLTIGFLTLGASGVALALAAPQISYPLLIPGLVLQGIGLGIVLTVNDPTGLGAVDDDEQGQASGVINTTEQLGGAVGIALLTAVLLGTYRDRLYDLLAKKGIHPTAAQSSEWKQFILTIEQRGREHINFHHQDDVIRYAIHDVVVAHAHAYQIVFFSTSGIAILGAIFSWFLVTKNTRIEEGHIFVRRSRWQYTNTGRTPGVTKRPPTAREIASDRAEDEAR